MDHLNRMLTAAAATAVLLVFTATALAAGFASGTYAGSLATPRTSYLVALKLAGTKLGPVKISNIPFYCSSGGPPLPVTFPKAKISSKGAFTIKVANKIKVGPLKGHVGEKLTISGTFTTHGTVRGTLKTVVVNAKACSGSSKFTATKS